MKVAKILCNNVAFIDKKHFITIKEVVSPSNLSYFSATTYYYYYNYYYYCYLLLLPTINMIKQINFFFNNKSLEKDFHKSPRQKGFKGLFLLKKMKKELEEEKTLLMLLYL